MPVFITAIDAVIEIRAAQTYSRKLVSTILGSVVKLLIGIVLFAGLPLLGWGVMDLQGFIRNPVRLAYIGVVVLLQVLIVIQIPEVGRNRGEGKKIVQRQRLAVLLLQVISLAVVIGAPYSDRWGVATLGEGNAIRYLGLVLFALGFTAMNWAEAILGKQFSVQVTIQEGHTLVTEGLYRYVRHPRYVGIIVCNVGLALVYRSWLALVLVAALIGVLLWRIQDEEALMQSEFGMEWQNYSTQSWRLIPFVY